jgi:hypothetical protein
MRPLTTSVALLAGLALAAPGAARAQAPAAPPPEADYTTNRAYCHFLTSPYSYRTYSASRPAYTVEGYSPLGYERISRDTGYLHERFTPRGYERFEVVPGYRGTVIRPVVPAPVVPAPAVSPPDQLPVPVPVPPSPGR